MERDMDNKLNALIDAAHNVLSNRGSHASRSILRRRLSEFERSRDAKEAPVPCDIERVYEPYPGAFDDILGEECT